MFPNSTQRQGDVIFVLSSWVTGNSSSIKQPDRESEREQSQALSLWAEQTGRADG